MAIPRLYIRDVDDKTIATLDSGDYFDDTLTRYLSGKASVLEFSIVKNEGDYEMYSAGKKISFRYEDEDFWLSMMIADQDETILTITAVSLNLELNNETAGPYKASKAMTFKEYLETTVNFDKTITIGINEVSDKKIINEWTGSSTLLARLFSLANVFEAELEFETKLNANGSLKEIILNVYKAHSDNVQGLGTDRRSKTFRFGHAINTVRKTEDISDIYTAIRPVGKDGLTIKDVEHEVVDENGNILYATYKTAKPGFQDPNKIYAPQSRDNFPSTLSEDNDHWIVSNPDATDYSSPEALYGYALSQLKANCVPQTTWEISGYIDARIGDTIRVADDGYKPEIYLDARITEQTISFTNPSQNKSTFSNVKELQSQVSANLLDEMNKLIEANKVYTCTISTDNGIIFKNGEGSTTLTAIVRDSAVEVTDKFSIEWFKDGVFLDIGAEITVNASNADGKSVYKFVAKKADETVAGMYEVTVTDVSDGKKGDPGTSPIITPNEDGTITIVDDEGTKVTPDLTGPQGPPTGITESETIPTDPYVGMLWKNIGEEPSYIPNATYRWNGSTWGLYLFTAENISASKLSAITANLGTITAGVINGITINGSEFNSNYKNLPIEGSDGITGSTATGTGRLDNELTFDGTIDTTHNFSTSYGPTGLLGTIKRNADGHLVGFGLSAIGGLSLHDDDFIEYGNVSLGYQDLITVRSTAITANSSQFVAYDSGTNAPLASRQGRIVQIKGAFKPVVSIPKANAQNEYLMGILPVWARPKDYINFLAQASGGNIYLCVVNTNGQITMSRYRNGGAYADLAVGAWLNIATVYAAGDIV